MDSKQYAKIWMITPHFYGKRLENRDSLTKSVRAPKAAAKLIALLLGPKLGLIKVTCSKPFLAVRSSVDGEPVWRSPMHHRKTQKVVISVQTSFCAASIMFS